MSEAIKLTHSMCPADVRTIGRQTDIIVQIGVWLFIELLFVICYLLLLTNARSLFICRHSFYNFSCYRRETRMAGLSFYPFNFRYFWPVQYRTTLYDGMW